MVDAERSVAVSGETGDGFAVFYARWRDPLRRALALTLGSVAFADEAIDEAMSRAAANWGQIGIYDSPQGWVYRVGLNWARGIFRKRRREVLTDSFVDPGQESPKPDLDLLRAVGQLPTRQRSIVVARYYLDWSTAEVATAFDIPAGTVKSRLSRALARLAKDLGESQ
ncbi:MAG: RNA polymerase sigma factor [Actinobacteria bacterium]|nr:RNA polymerase sigma factor [Actinomycetota bacterium]